MADQSEFHGSEVDKEVVQTQKSEGEKVRKREVKLTAKGLMAKLDILQKQSKLKFDKASQLKRTIQEYMSNRESNHEVKGVFEKFKIQCKEAKESHESLIVLLPDVFIAKMLWVEDFISVVNNWLEKLQEEFDCAASEIEPNDSVSNIETRVSSHTSSRKSSHHSSRSSKSSSSVQLARVQIEAEKAALVTQSESLKEKHNIEQQLEMLQKQKEQMDIDAKIAASNAKLSVLKDFEQGADSIVTDGMESYVNKQSKSTTVSLHPDVKKQPMTALESRKGVTSQPRASHHSQRNVSSRSRIPGACTMMVDEQIQSYRISFELTKPNHSNLALLVP